MFRTRSLAAKACQAGHVKIDGRTVKAARPVRPGDRVELTTPRRARILDVVALAEKRGPAAVACGLYDDKTPAPPVEEATSPPRDRGAGRPSKRDRRQLARLKGR